MVCRLLAVIGACFLAAACGGGGGGSSSASTSMAITPSATPPPAAAPAPPPLSNFTAIVVDGGPAALNTGSNAYTADNTPYVSVKICAPGSTTNCQTVDHVLLDTGSVGLRVYASVLNSSLLSALPLQTDTTANPVGECFGYIDGYVFGSVRQADFQVGGEAVSAMPFQAIADGGVFATVPPSCSSGGGMNLATVQDFAANGVLGIGQTTTDCGSACTAAGGSGAATYYDCPAAGCSTIIARAASTSAPFQQLPNPVAAMSVDNNGTVISLPAAPASGQASVTGMLYFGIGTQTNNAIGSATILTTTTSQSSTGVGFLNVVYNGQTLSNSFIDSGSNFYIFVDKSLTACTDKNYIGYYCPASPQNLNVTVQGSNAVNASATLALNNAQTLFNTGFSALPGIGGNPNLINGLTPFPKSFDLGFPFFYGRTIYTAIEGRAAAGTTGPYFAF